MIQGMAEGEYYYTDLVWEDSSEKETFKFKNKKNSDIKRYGRKLSQADRAGLRASDI